MIADTGFEYGHIQPEVLGILNKRTGSQRLAAEKLVVIFPVNILLAGTHGSFSSAQRIGVNGGQWQVAIDQPDLAGIGGQQRLVDFSKPATAERTLIITELHDCDRRVRGSESIEVICRNVVTLILCLLS